MLYHIYDLIGLRLLVSCADEETAIKILSRIDFHTQVSLIKCNPDADDNGYVEVCKWDGD